MKRSYFIAFLLLTTFLFAVEPYKDAGSSGFAFLKIKGSPKSNAMGNTGVAGDYSFGLNPASYAELDRGVRSSYQYLILSTHLGDLNFYYPNNIGNFVFSIYYLTSPGIDKTDEIGNKLGEFSYSIIMPSVIFSKKLQKNFKIGIEGKYLYSSVDEYNAMAFAFGFGAIYDIEEFPGLSVGISIDNLGSQISAYNEEKDALPFRFSGGLNFSKNFFTMNFDINKSQDTKLFWALGAEVLPHELIALRLGFNSKGLEWKTGGSSDILGGMTFGIGLSWNKYSFDYAIIPMVDLGMSHKLGLGILF